jgi:hypothetical protein
VRPAEAAWRLIEPYWEAVSIYRGPVAFLDAFERLPPAARHLFAVWWCDAEVCNGGFHQFFSNPTGVLAPEALDGFRAVGLRECAEIAEAAISKLGEPYPRDQEARDAALRSVELPGEKREAWDPFYNLDERYYAAKKRENFYGKLNDFAGAKPDSR